MNYAKNAVALMPVVVLAMNIIGCKSASDSTVSLGALPASTHGVEGSAEARKRAANLSILSFNMEHKDNPKQLSVMAERLKSDLSEVPDFILLQEVMFDRAERKGHDSTAGVLAAELGYHVEGTKRTSDDEGIAILSRYPFAYYDSINLKSQTSRLLLGFRRVSAMAEFMVPGTGRVRVVNVHFTNWGFEQHVRESQIEETLKWLNERERQVHADVTFFGGDFNMKPNGDEMNLVLQAGDDALKFQNYNTTQPTRGRKGHPHMRVDYIFVAAPKRNAKLVGEEELLWKEGIVSKTDEGASRIYLSDHVPVLHEYAIQRAALARVASAKSRANQIVQAPGQE